MGAWRNGLCGCFDNCGLCVITYFLPCVTAGHNAEHVGKSCFLYGCLSLLGPISIWSRAKIRGMIREQKGIDVSFCTLLVFHVYCLWYTCLLCVLHIYCQWFTFTLCLACILSSYVYCQWYTCLLYALHVYCRVFHVYCMCITCLLYLFFMYIVRILFICCPSNICLLYIPVYCMCFICLLCVSYMFTVRIIYVTIHVLQVTFVSFMFTVRVFQGFYSILSIVCKLKCAR